ncbi:MAG: alpha/beta hydrolase [Spirochaetota bacterium]
MDATYTTIDTIRTRYRRSEKTNSPTLLLTNAWPQSIRCWDSSWDKLSQQFGLLAYDMPGFGLSEGNLDRMSPSQQGTFALKLMDHFGIDKVHGVGPDVGMPVMLWLAENHPDRLYSIITFNGPAFYPPFASLELDALIKSKELRQITSYTGLGFAAIAIIRGYQHFTPPLDALLEYAQFNGNAEKFSLTLEYLASYPQELKVIGEKLKQIDVPVFLLWGDKDPFLHIENAQQTRNLLKHCKYQVLQGCGHFSHEDAGKMFVEAVCKWCLEEYKNIG